MPDNLKYNNIVNLKIKNSSYTKIINQIHDKSFILDIGCARGYLGEFLNKQKGCEVVGVDFLEEFLDICQKKGCYKELIQINLNELSNQLDKYIGKFDYILMLDVIEHLYNPSEVIENLKKLLTPEGKIIFSIPNIAHASVKISLMQNKFRYTKEGLLDNSHIRFFTLESLIELFNSLKMSIDNLDYIYQSFYSNLDKDLHKEGKKIGNYLKNDFESYVFQYIVTTSNKEKDNTVYLKELKPIKRAKKQVSILYRIFIKYKTAFNWKD